MSKLRNLLVCAALLAIPAASHAQGTTVLTFDIAGAGNGSTIPQDYGDNVSAALMGTYSYGGGDGFTPNVSVVYGTGDSATFWGPDYGDLTNVAYTTSLQLLFVTLVAQPGFSVTLNSFDVAGWPNTDYEINSVQVFGPGNTILFEDILANIEGDLVGPRHTTFAVGPLTSTSFLTIQLDVSNLGGAGDNIGIDNISFTQNALGAAAPEPGTAGLVLPLLLTGASIAVRRRMAGK